MDTGTLLNEKMAELKKAKKVSEHFTAISHELEKEYAKEKKLHKELESEFLDVEKLENKSVKSIFADILGNRAKQLEKERQEYLDASMRYKECKKSIELLEFEKNIVQEKVQNLTLLKEQIRELFVRREKELISLNTSEGRAIQQVIYKIDQLKGRETDLQMAQGAGKDTLGHLNNVINHLKQAEQWGYHGRGRGYHRDPYRHVDLALRAATHANHALRKFNGILRQLYNNYSPVRFDMHFDRSRNFIEVLINNMISDWVIQNKIRNSLNSVVSSHDDVLRTIQHIEQELKKIEQEIFDRQEERKQLILKA